MTRQPWPISGTGGRKMKYEDVTRQRFHKTWPDWEQMGVCVCVCDYTNAMKMAATAKEPQRN